ncbi:S5A-REDUCTASE domain-containing protein [Mycena chlorophos]|uniref:S5A-REDUCTASE domain-containing protein n=1 Tax=Mycena chlorophos TaxID=658473 RepID=A0A8H6RYY4_MYCCL|nr:S5A-REDUCTASE domain-containing protein [Mycena chlorophos]
MPVHAVLDNYYLALTLLVTVVYQLSGFAIAWTLQFDKITDLTGGSNFFILGKFSLLTLLVGGTFQTRNVVASALVMVWAVRIAGFLFFRVLKTGHDGRFDEIRSSFFKFLAFWIGQILWVWLVSLPVTILNSPAVSDPAHGGSSPRFGTSRDIAGLVLWGIGFLMEAHNSRRAEGSSPLVFQSMALTGLKYRYKSSKTISKDLPIASGVWAWSRHPQYFGEMMCWWGMWILCLSPTTDGSVSGNARSAQYGAIVSPIFTVIVLMFGSGMPTSVKPQAKRFYLKSYGPGAKPEQAIIWSQYKEYVRRTSILIPLPPVVYAPLPEFIKNTILFNWPVIFQFSEEKDGRAAVEEAESNLI